MKLFYEENKQAARELVAKQILDCWEYAQIEEYWYALGYDIFFVTSVIKPMFINCGAKTK
jgi:hypothetical protein